VTPFRLIEVKNKIKTKKQKKTHTPTTTHTRAQKERINKKHTENITSTQRHTPYASMSLETRRGFEKEYHPSTVHSPRASHAELHSPTETQTHNQTHTTTTNKHSHAYTPCLSPANLMKEVSRSNDLAEKGGSFQR
jgi:hypothetical protein